MFLLLSWSFLIPLYFLYISFLPSPLLSVHFFHPCPSHPLQCLALFPLLLLLSPHVVTLLSFSPLPISLLPSASSSPLSHPLLCCPPCLPFVSPFCSTLVLSSLSLSLPFLSSPVSSHVLFPLLFCHFLPLFLFSYSRSSSAVSPLIPSFSFLLSPVLFKPSLPLSFLHCLPLSPLLTSTFLSFPSSWLITFPFFSLFHSSSFLSPFLSSLLLASSLPSSSDCPLLISSF